MKIKFCVIALSLFLFNTSSVFAQQELIELTDRVYAYIDITEANPSMNSFGANCGVIVGDNDVMVIDTLVNAKQAQRLIQQIQSITNKPIQYVVNTHHHLDHTGGNSAFEKLGATIIGHMDLPLTEKKAADSIANAEGYGLSAEDMAGTEASVPALKFTDTLTIDLGAITVDLNFPGPSHTNSSIMAYVVESDVLFAGDIIFNKYHPFIADSDISAWMDVLADIDALDAEIIVPGHGPQVSKEDIVDFAIYLSEFDSNAQRLCEGKTQEEAPAIAEEMLKILPEQGRGELSNMVEVNLKMKYLPAQ